MNKSKKNYLTILILGTVFAILPVLQINNIFVSFASITIIAQVIFYTIAGIGLNVLLGYSGLVSLGTAGFMGLGAYIAGYFAQSNAILGIVLAILIPIILGLIVGLISLRLEGYYLAIATLGIAEVLKVAFQELTKFTGGFSGLNISLPSFINDMRFLGPQTPRVVTVWIIVAVFVVIWLFTYNFINSRTGRALLTMRGSSAAAQAMGINLLKYKLTAFVIATIYASISGILYIYMIKSAFPTTWNLMLSLQILAVIVIGGVKTITGPLIGAAIVFGVPELVFKQIPLLSGIDGLAYIFTGLLIIVVILFYPNGLIYIGTDIKNLFKKLFKKNKAVQ